MSQQSLPKREKKYSRIYVSSIQWKFKTKLTEEKKIYYESNKNENATYMLGEKSVNTRPPFT